MASENSNWREELKRLGKQAFELSEMERLGFWPPSEEARERTRTAREEWQKVQEELAPLRKRERELQKKIAEVGDIASLLDEARRTRIERVRREREERKARRAFEARQRADKDAAWRHGTLPHLGRGVSAGLRYEGGDDAKLEAAGLPVLRSAAEVAAALQITPGRLAWLCYHRGASATDHYRRWSIAKKSGGRRQLAAPKPSLRAAQDWLLTAVLAKVPVHPAAAAFRPGLHIGHNAARHAHAPGGPTELLRFDLENFFPTVTFPRVKKGFMSLGYNEGVATLFALLCTEAPRVALALDGTTHHVAVAERSVPQGAPTSPALTNFLCRRLDARLDGMARGYGFVYSHYADDMIFSIGEKSELDKLNNPTLQLRRFALEIIEECGFVVNAKKTATLRPHRRQTVTGIVVNGAQGDNAKGGSAPRLSRRDMRNFRAFLHQFQLHGRETMTEKIGKDALAYAQGYLSFIHMVNEAQEAKIRRDFPWLASWHQR